MAILDQIYEAVTEEDAYEALPAAIARSLDARSCVIFQFDQTLQLKAAATSYFSPDIVDYQLTEDIRALDIWTAYGAQPHHIGRVHNSDDVWDLVTFLRTPFYNEVIHKFGDDTVRSMGAVTRCSQGYASVAVHSGKGAPRFDRTHAATLTRYLPHLFRMLDLRARLNASRSDRDVLQRALDLLPSGVLAIDGRLKLKAANRAGLAILERADGLRSLCGRVLTVDTRLQERFARAVASASTWSGEHGDAFILDRSNGKPSYRVLVSPLSATQQLALVIIENPDARDLGLSSTLSKMYGLTGAEADLAALLVEGLTPEEAAAAREVRLTTVRTQIQALLAKTDARRLTDLIQLLATAPHTASAVEPDQSRLPGAPAACLRPLLIT